MENRIIVSRSVLPGPEARLECPARPAEKPSQPIAAPVDEAQTPGLIVRFVVHSRL
jgi:hypothetical protein